MKNKILDIDPTNGKANYNKLIEKGVYYSNVVSTAPSTAMSLTSMFTGLYVHELGRRSYSNEDSGIPSDTVSLFKDLENQGKILDLKKGS